MPLISNAGDVTFEADLEAVFETLQLQRSAQLTTTRDMQLASRLLVGAELRRLIARFGPDDPRVARYAAGGAAILRRVAALDIETQIADIRVPPADPTQTVLQGRVIDTSLNAVPGLEVTLVDTQAQAIAGIEPVKADASGYYAFTLQPAQVEVIGASLGVMLQVGSDSASLVPSASKPLTLEAGKTTVIETRLQPAELERLQLIAPGSAAPKKKS